MFVAYLLPNPTNSFDLLEDGLQWIAGGATKDEACSTLLFRFQDQLRRESYSATEIEEIWNQHKSFVAEV